MAAAEIRRLYPDLPLPDAVRSTGVAAGASATVPAGRAAGRHRARRPTALLAEVEGTVGVITPVAAPRRGGRLAGRARPVRGCRWSTSLQAKGMEYDGVVLVAPSEIRADPRPGVRTLYVALVPGHPAAHHASTRPAEIPVRGAPPADPIVR